MSFTLNILFVTIALTAIAFAKPKPIAIDPCGENMHFKECGTTCPAYCNGPESVICNKMCKNGCFCDDGFVLDRKGGDACVRIDQCPKSGDNEEKDEKCALVRCVAGDVCRDGECIRNPDCPMFMMSPPKEGCKYVDEIDPVNDCPVPVEHCDTSDK
uniref:TIL domain-containing protein n=1 Tax=Plectus sambesii TaxID=2011161 RepID=A0A914UHE6_9BILA